MGYVWHATSSDKAQRLQDVSDGGGGPLPLEMALAYARAVIQEGEGSVLYLGARTVERVRAYLVVAAIDAGPLFQRLDKAGHPRSRLSARSIRSIVQRRAADAGIEGRVSGHSLRVGSAQSLAQAGASVVELQTAGRWQSPSMPGRYARGPLAARGAVAKFRYPQDGGSK